MQATCCSILIPSDSNIAALFFLSASTCICIASFTLWGSLMSPWRISIYVIHNDFKRHRAKDKIDRYNTNHYIMKKESMFFFNSMLGTFNIWCVINKFLIKNKLLPIINDV